MPLAHLGDPFKVSNSKTTKCSLEDMVVDEQNGYNEHNKEDTELTGETLREIELKNVAKAGHPKADPGQFSIIKVLGQGSFGKVLLVRKLVGPDANTLYAMKVLKKASLKATFSRYESSNSVRYAINTRLLSPAFKHDDSTLELFLRAVFYL
ncbi:ribosomal protein S6 kinase alpha-3 [Trichonephila clavipes]|nr:ribosomal protein S6 kinase alpha-3 [Trichonephila clavipes]